MRLAYCGDFHAPHTVGWAFKRVMDIVDGFKPDVFGNLGDWADLSAAGKHPTVDGHTQEEEYDACAEQCTTINQVVDGQKEWWLGNHEWRISNHCANVDNRIRSLLSWENHVPFKKALAGWKIHPYEFSRRGITRRGPVVVGHGYRTGASGVAREAIEAMELVGWPSQGIYIHGHDHSLYGPLQAKRGTQNLPWWHCSPGTLGPLQPSYAKKVRTYDWRHGVCLIEVLKNRMVVEVIDVGVTSGGRGRQSYRLTLGH